MRTIRLRRVLVLVSAALGLLATAVPPAHATTTTSVTFEGNATVPGGLSYPCVLDATINTSKCSTPSTTTTKPGTITGGHTRGFAFASTTCVAAVTSNLPHLKAGAGLCTIVAGGVVTGSCGLSSGLGNFTVKIDKTFVLPGPPTVTGTLLTTITGTFHFTGLGGTLVITGTTSTGGTVTGAAEAAPVPTPDGTTVDNSCSNKTADEFEIAGEVTAIEP